MGIPMAKSRAETRSITKQDFLNLANKFVIHSSKGNDRGHRDFALKAEDYFSVENFGEAAETLQDLYAKVAPLGRKYQRDSLEEILRLIAGLRALQKEAAKKKLLEQGVSITPEEEPTIWRAVKALAKIIDPKQPVSFKKNLHVRINALGLSKYSSFDVQIEGMFGKKTGLIAPSHEVWPLLSKITPKSKREIAKINQEEFGFGPRIELASHASRSEARVPSERLG